MFRNVVADYGGIYSNVLKYATMLECVGMLRICLNVVESGGMWKTVSKCFRMWWNVSELCEKWRIVSESGGTCWIGRNVTDGC